MPESYENLVEDLKALDLPFSENAWTTRPNCDDYGVVSMEFEGDSDDGDNLKQDRSWEGTIDLYSKAKRGNGWPAAIEAILTEACECSWELNGPTWENGSLLFHWQWDFRMEE